jgi:O-antigen/teichoic acid export membrane protein
VRSRATLWLGVASAADYAVQLLLPALLVRSLSPPEFGGYRLLWMAAQTAALVLSLNMALNLVYLAPRHPPQRRGALLGNALLFLLGAGLLAAAFASTLPRLTGGGLDGLLPAWALPCFVFAWMLSLPFDQIGQVAGQPLAQARLTMLQTGLRIGLLGAAAWWSRSLAGVALAMIALALVRLCLVLAFAKGSGAFGSLRPDGALARAQFRYGIGFGLGASLFALRGQADGWIAAALFDPVALATISIALAIVPIIGVIRQTYTSATVAEVARLVAARQTDAALLINRRANLSTAMLVFPLIGGFCAVAPELISLVYTPTYVDAATPARIYALAYAICVLEMSTVVQALGEGRFVLRSGAVLLVIGTLATLAGGALWGLPGIALGSLLSMWLGSAWNIHRVAARCQLPWSALQPWREMALMFLVAALSLAISATAMAQFAEGTALQRALAGGAGYLIFHVVLVSLVAPARRLHLSTWRSPRSAGASVVASQS